MRNPNPSYDVFLSYSTDDIQIMRKVLRSLEEQNISVWVDKNMLRANTRSWTQAIERGIENSCCLVCVLTPGAKKSSWVREEIFYAASQLKPVLFLWVYGEPKQVTILGYATAQLIDVRKNKKRFGQGIKELVAAIRLSCEEGKVPPTLDRSQLTALEIIARDIAKNVLPADADARVCFFSKDTFSDTAAIVACYGRFEDKERQISFKISTPNPEGAVGKVWNTGQFIVVDERDKLSSKELKKIFHLSSEQIKVTRHLKTIIEVPIFESNESSELLSVLSVDSGKPLSAFVKNNKELGELIEKLSSIGIEAREFLKPKVTTAK